MAIALAAQLNQQVGSAVVLLQDLQRMSSTLRYLNEFRARLIREAPAGPEIPPPAQLHTGIELVGVEFRYPGQTSPVLRDINLTLPAGATVAIIGENGAGKTTLVKLLCGFYQPSAGLILVDGTHLGDLSLAQWRQRVTAGFQDFARFELLARETVGVGNLPRIDSSSAVMNALRHAHAADLVADLPEGLATQLGKSYADGVELSGGQWQKLALGRAFMREHPLLVILDEPTAALDPAAEHALFERYAEHARRTASMTGAITVLVSHRFSTVRMADLIVVVAGGHVEEMGDHETLMRSRGLYRELYQLQAQAYG
jgi:ATP-binding cassette subfamily B protein